MKHTSYFQYLNQTASDFVSAAAAEALTSVYGNIGSFTGHAYAYFGFPARTFKTFRDIAVDACNLRFYGGIHYQPSIDAGLKREGSSDKILQMSWRNFQ